MIQTTHGGQGRHGYSLTLGPSVVGTAGSHEPVDLTDMARDWTRSIRLQGGFWTGTFSIPLSKRAFDAFDTWLGCHVVERSGGMVTWEGMVYEMELSTGGFVYRVTLDTMVNRCRADYDEPSGGLSETDWAINAASITRFGIKEEAIPVTTTYPEIAERVRDAYLEEHGWPWPEIASVCPTGKDELRVTVNGYCFMLNWKYQSGGACWEDCETYPGGCDSDTPACDVVESVANFSYDFVNNIWTDTDLDFTAYQTVPPAPGAPIEEWARCCLYINTDIGQCYAYLGVLNGGVNHIDCYSDPDLQTPGLSTIPPTGSLGTPLDANYLITHGTSEWLQTILTADWVGIINKGSIMTNRIQVFRYSGNRADIGNERAWSAIQRAVSLGDWDNHPWRAWVGPERYLNFNEISTVPVAFVVDGKWCSDRAGSELNPWQLRPGVGKAVNYRYAATRTGYWLEDPAAFLMNEVTVNSSGNIHPSITDVSQVENLLTYLATMPSSTKSGIGGEAPLPPNWNVEAGTYNPPGPTDAPYGGLNGYWTEPSPGVYVWIPMLGLAGQPAWPR